MRFVIKIIYICALSISTLSVENLAKNRWLFFVLGFVLGSILSVVFYDNMVNTKENTVGKQNIVADTLSKPEKPKVIVKNKTKTASSSSEKKVKSHKKKSIDKTKGKIIKNHSSLSEDTVNLEVKANADTLILKNTASVQDSVFEENTSDIEVAHDEMLFSKYMIPAGDSANYFCQNSNRQLDSLLVDNNSQTNEKGLLVEFWISPVNFTGYKLNKKKLILFGVVEFDSLKLFYHSDKSLLMKYKRQTFNLECGNDYTSLDLKSKKP